MDCLKRRIMMLNLKMIHLPNKSNWSTVREDCECIGYGLRITTPRFICFMT